MVGGLGNVVLRWQISLSEVGSFIRNFMFQCLSLFNNPVVLVMNGRENCVRCKPLCIEHNKFYRHL